MAGRFFGEAIASGSHRASIEALFIAGFCATDGAPWQVIDAQRRRAEALACAAL